MQHPGGGPEAEADPAVEAGLPGARLGPVQRPVARRHALHVRARRPALHRIIAWKIFVRLIKDICMTNKSKCVNHKNILFQKYFNYPQNFQKIFVVR